MRNSSTQQRRMYRNRAEIGRQGGFFPNFSSKFMLICGIGLIDSIGFLQYLLDFDQTYFYLVLIYIKIVAVMTSKWNLRASFVAMPLIGTILFGLLVSSAFNSVDIIDVFRVLVAAFSIVLTLVIIDGNFKTYSVGLAINGFIISILYIILYRAGSIYEANDRLYFFNGSHPNLGGEILSVIVILSTASLRPVAFSALFTVSTYCCWLMQSRTSIIAMLLSASLYAVFWTYDRFGRIKGTLALVVIFTFGFAYLFIGASTGSDDLAQILDFMYNSVFLVEDSYRGSDTGLSGRDLHWYQTLQIIDDNFFAGAGIEYPRRLDILQPHNWFLYPVALFGIFGFFVILAMVVAIYKVASSNAHELVRILPIIVLLMLNDRFMNLNINPLGIYVYLFARLYQPLPNDVVYRRTSLGRPNPRASLGRSR